MKSARRRYAFEPLIALAVALSILNAPRLAAARSHYHHREYERRSHSRDTDHYYGSWPRGHRSTRESTHETAGERSTLESEPSRDSHGRIKRSESAKREFERETGHPEGWPGHAVDHITPLACGGADDPSNMQWQTTAEAKAKDKRERQGCGNRR